MNKTTGVPGQGVGGKGGGEGREVEVEDLFMRPTVQHCIYH